MYDKDGEETIKEEARDDGVDFIGMLMLEWYDNGDDNDDIL